MDQLLMRTDRFRQFGNLLIEGARHRCLAGTRDCFGPPQEQGAALREIGGIVEGEQFQSRTVLLLGAFVGREAAEQVLRRRGQRDPAGGRSRCGEGTLRWMPRSSSETVSADMTSDSSSGKDATRRSSSTWRRSASMKTLESINNVTRPVVLASCG